MLPYQREIKRVERRWHRAAVLNQLWDYDPAAVYAGLLAYASDRTKSNGQPWDAVGWSRHAFKEIFGTWPRPQDRHVAPKPLPNDLIEEWAAGRKRKARPRALPLFQR